MLDFVGLAVLLVFYGVITAIGIVASIWYKKKVLGGAGDTQEVSLVAGRKLGGVVGIFTMTATTVGGGFINGTSESIATAGVVWTLAPLGICIGLIIGGTVFAKRMRDENYLTMLDPFQRKYGDTVVGLLYIAAITGDIFWAASILAALGTSLSVIIRLDVTIAIVTSAAVAVVYTMFGQLVSVAYTDIAQLIFIVVGLVLAIPFVLINPLVEDLRKTAPTWLGSLEAEHTGLWLDLLVAMTLGSIPWQTYFQRVLAVKSSRHAQVLSVAGGCGALVLAVPPMLIGAAAVSTDWNSTVLGRSPLDSNQASTVLPLVLHNLTPRPVALIGLGAIAAAVMSSIDSAVLSSASLFTHNIYKMLLHKKATERELMIVQRVMLFVVGAVAATLAIFVSSIYGMFIMAADIVFVIMFPQLVCVLFFRRSNAYGAIAGYAVGLLLRITAGETYLSLPALVKYPLYSDESGQLFPFRTFAMLCSLFTIVGVSHATRFIFVTRQFSAKFDFFHCYHGNTNAGPRGSEGERGTNGDRLMNPQMADVCLVLPTSFHSHKSIAESNTRQGESAKPDAESVMGPLQGYPLCAPDGYPETD